MQPARLLKRRNPFGECTKVTSQISALPCIRYSRAVKNKLVKQGFPRLAQRFQSKARQWGQKILDTPLVSHVDKGGRLNFYLALNVTKEPFGVRWFQDDGSRELTKAEVEPFLPKKSTECIVYRNVRLDHIAQLRLHGEVWNIRPAWDRYQAFLSVKKSDAQADTHRAGNPVQQPQVNA